jgi:hypothetical protein
MKYSSSIAADNNSVTTMQIQIMTASRAIEPSKRNLEKIMKIA